MQQPSGKFHGTSFDIAPEGLHGASGGQVLIRLSALLAAFVLIWTLVTGTVVDAAQSAFIATMLGFTWHAGAHFTWNSHR
ncbi:MAG TPA: hypothetical protein DD420_16580 [Streptomyces sp.]|nr:hypothetical protein [Streptomyces sp.]